MKHPGTERTGTVPGPGDLGVFLERHQQRIGDYLHEQGIPPEDAPRILEQALVALVYRWREVASPAAWLEVALAIHCQRYWRLCGGRPPARPGLGGVAPGSALLDLDGPPPP